MKPIDQRSQPPAPSPALPPRSAAYARARAVLRHTHAAHPAAGQAPATGSPGDLVELGLEGLLDLRVESVTTASKYSQKVTNAPASVTVVTGDEIRRLGYRDLADVLRGVRGFYVNYDRNYSNLGSRGFARPGDFNTRVLLLVDGHRMNDDLYDSALIGSEAIVDVDLIDRVEVIRGPSSSIYGSSAFFAVVNVITRRAAEIHGVEAVAETGTADTFKAVLTYGAALPSGPELVLSASRTSTDGARRLYFPEFDVPQIHDGVVENADAELAEHQLGSVRFAGLSLTAAHSRRDKEIPTASYGTVFDDGRQEASDERSFVDLKYERDMSASLALAGRVYHDRYAYRATYPFDFAAAGEAPQIVLNHDENVGEALGADLQWTYQPRDGQTFVFGGETRQDLRLSQSSFSGDPRQYTSRDERRGSSLGVYAQGELAFRDDLLLNAGLRYDDFSEFDGVLSPRFALIYSPSDRRTFKLLYGQAYRAPNAYEQYQQTPYYSKANPELEPETIRTYELVYEGYLPSGLRLGASAYYYDIDDLISQCVDPRDGLLQFRNVDSVAARGVELEAERKFADGKLFRASYALQQAEDGETGAGLTSSPRQLLKVAVVFALLRQQLFGSLDLQYTSALGTLAGGSTSGYWLANATLWSRELFPRVDLSATVYNLFDQRYAHPGSTAHVQDQIPQDGRSLRLRLAYRF